MVTNGIKMFFCGGKSDKNVAISRLNRGEIIFVRAF